MAGGGEGLGGGVDGRVPILRIARARVGDLLQAKIATAPLIRADDSWDSLVERLIRQVLVKRTASKPANGDIDVGFPHLLAVVNDASQEGRKH
jgi:hypothetical protein